MAPTIWCSFLTEVTLLLWNNEMTCFLTKFSKCSDHSAELKAGWFHLCFRFVHGLHDSSVTHSIGKERTAHSATSASSTGSGIFCSYCHKVFHSVSGKQRHERLHTGNVHTCLTCGVPFTTEDNLRRHSQIHKRERTKFFCSNCGRSFTRSDNRNAHQKICLSQGQ